MKEFEEDIVQGQKEPQVPSNVSNDVANAVGTVENDTVDVNDKEVSTSITEIDVDDKKGQPSEINIDVDDKKSQPSSTIDVNDTVNNVEEKNRQQNELNQIDNDIKRKANIAIELQKIDFDRIEDYPRQIETANVYKKEIQELIDKKNSIIGEQNK